MVKSSYCSILVGYQAREIKEKVCAKRLDLNFAADAKTPFHLPFHLSRLDNSIMASKSLLRPLSKSVYYLPAPSVPTLSSSSKPVKDPSLLIVFGWMDAQLRHIEKYLTSYRSLVRSSPFPSHSQKEKLIPTFLFVVSSRVVRFCCYNLVRVGFIQRRKHSNLGKSLDRQSK